MIPSLNKNGLLPQGIHKATLDEVRQRFGSANQRRRQLFSGLVRALKNLKEAGVITVYLNGSFVARKRDPNDVDGCWDPTTHTDVGLLDPVFLDFSAARSRMKARYGVDFFIANQVEGGSGYPFVDFFQTSRDGKRKGILRIDLGDETL